MSKTFRHTIWVSVLLACGALVTACQSSSDKDQSERKTANVKGAKETSPSKVERAHAPTVSSPRTESADSPASEPVTHQRSVASTKATHAQSATHAKAKAHADANTASKSAGKPSNTASSGYSSYGDSEAGAGITDPPDSEKTATGSTRPARKQSRAGQ
jgi:hypothetical protein